MSLAQLGRKQATATKL